MKESLLVYVMFARMTTMDGAKFDMKHGDLQEITLPNHERIVCTPSGGLYAETRTPFCILPIANYPTVLAVNEACYCLCSDVVCKSLKDANDEHRDAPLQSAK